MWILFHVDSLRTKNTFTVLSYYTLITSTPYIKGIANYPRVNIHKYFIKQLAKACIAKWWPFNTFSASDSCSHEYLCSACTIMQELVTQNIINILFATHETLRIMRTNVCAHLEITENVVKCACSITSFIGALSRVFQLNVMTTFPVKN